MAGLEFNPLDVWEINPPERRKDNKGYSAPFPVWWRHYGLKGDGFIVGENKIQGDFINKKLKEEFPEVKRGYSIDLINSEFNVDLSQKFMIPFSTIKPDWIFCMAVLEHTLDPMRVVRHLAKILYFDGLLCLSFPNNGFKQHRRPYDCFRFLEDFITEAIPRVGELKLLDYVFCVEWCAIYRKE